MVILFINEIFKDEIQNMKDYFEKSGEIAERILTLE